MYAREKAFQILCQIILEKKYSNLVLRKEINDFSELDKHLITRIVYGTMQNYLYVRDQWYHFVDKKISNKMAILMDMSIYQLVFMDKLPQYAIVNEAVDIASKESHGKYKNMINAMLRRYLREERKALPTDPLKRLSLETSHPEWLVKMWNKQYGFETTAKICHDNQKTPLLACRINTLLASKNEIIKNNAHFKEGKLAKNSLIYDEGNIANTHEYLSGLITIQDEASQCVAEMLDPQENEKILDVCAAPGTKTTHIAQLMKNSGEIIACDIHEHRVHLIENSLSRLHIHNVKAMVNDALKCHENFEKESFDRILVDAPCSGYGVLKRKNDIKVHMQSSDMDEIIQIQKGILESVSGCLKDKGILVYSTCTLNKKENENQIKTFLNNHPEFKCIDMKTIYPYEYDCDGFFMAKLTKEKEYDNHINK